MSRVVKSFLTVRKLRCKSIETDGNSFYRAIAMAYYNDSDMHHMLRRTTMEHMLESVDTYMRYFPSMRVMMGKLNANKRLGVWSSDLTNLVPHVVSSILHCCIEVYSVTDAGDVTKNIFGEGPKIRLLNINNHYDLLIKD